MNRNLRGTLALAVLALTFRLHAATPMEITSGKAMEALSRMRQQYGLPPVRSDARLATRCEQWLQQMLAEGGMHHDPKVYGTPERENLAGGPNYPITVERSMRMWDNSPPHAASMFDRGFPQAVFGGYAEYQGFACLRLCPSMDGENGGPCS